MAAHYICEIIEKRRNRMRRRAMFIRLSNAPLSLPRNAFLNAGNSSTLFKQHAKAWNSPARMDHPFGNRLTLFVRMG